jgi:hypothetical protein
MVSACTLAPATHVSVEPTIRPRKVLNQPHVIHVSESLKRAKVAAILSAKRALARQVMCVTTAASLDLRTLVYTAVMIAVNFLVAAVKQTHVMVETRSCIHQLYVWASPMISVNFIVSWALMPRGLTSAVLAGTLVAVHANPSNVQVVTWFQHTRHLRAVMEVAAVRTIQHRGMNRRVHGSYPAASF